MIALSPAGFQTLSALSTTNPARGAKTVALITAAGRGTVRFVLK